MKKERYPEEIPRVKLALHEDALKNIHNFKAPRTVGNQTSMFVVYVLPPILAIAN